MASARLWSRPGHSVVALALVCSFSARDAEAQAAASREFQIRAAFLSNFGQFVTWAPGGLPDADVPFRICLLGDDPFGETLDGLVEGRQIQGRRVDVARLREVGDVGACQILYVSGSETSRLDTIFAALAGRSILTVGETEGFFERSGMIRFVVVANRLRLHVNAAAAAGVGLTISSRLLSLADVVRTDED